MPWESSPQRPRFQQWKAYKGYKVFRHPVWGDNHCCSSKENSLQTSSSSSYWIIHNRDIKHSHRGLCIPAGVTSIKISYLQKITKEDAWNNSYKNTGAHTHAHACTGKIHGHIGTCLSTHAQTRSQCLFHFWFPLQSWWVENLKESVKRKRYSVFLSHWIWISIDVLLRCNYFTHLYFYLCWIYSRFSPCFTHSTPTGSTGLRMLPDGNDESGKRLKYWIQQSLHNA